MQVIQPEQKYTGVDRIVTVIGSVPSLIIHSLAFAGFFVVALLGIATWEIVLLVLTTIVSLEAIYLAIFIQITVNRHSQSLKEVEEDIDEIQEDVEELGEDLEDIQEDIEEISEDIDEIQEDVEEMTEDETAAAKKPVKKKVSNDEVLDRLARDVERVLRDLEALKQAQNTK
jgi:septal ring factor EnvC (AmiA/AmiB activator)